MGHHLRSTDGVILKIKLGERDTERVLNIPQGKIKYPKAL